MYQIFHSVPVVWRSDRCVQFGVDEPILIDGLTPQDAELISVLRMGIGIEDFFDRAEHLGVSASRASSLLALLDEAGALVPVSTSSAARRPTAHVDAFAADRGAAPAVIAESLATTSVLTAGPLARALLPHLSATGFEATSIERAEDALTFAAPLVMLTGVWVEDAVTAGFLVEHGLPHLQLVVGQSQASISHVVVPGLTPCTKCAIIHRTDEDADWLLAWRTLWRQAPAPARTDPVLGSLALALATAVVRNHVLGVQPEPMGVTVTLPSGAVSESAAEFHPECDCRIPVPGELHASA
ncbi:hypothetical protein GCM10022261_15970 [Brevibacterium daeguense]|uniref:Bacteriocin biosynthesis cyclodehydratase domain-containing protein n=1 Tax=Brevibacterium daeguense TaxID=909936 RepID=A0ABP8EJE0_9MICO|nr:hypothetical protein [Brevibacterium daeguense]